MPCGILRAFETQNPRTAIQHLLPVVLAQLKLSLAPNIMWVPQVFPSRRCEKYSSSRVFAHQALEDTHVVFGDFRQPISGNRMKIYYAGYIDLSFCPGMTVSYLIEFMIRNMNRVVHIF